ncbi:MAG TPA: Fe-S cluster assembly ATPase SufC [Longimicrobiales bacterium]|nr:Fe-S cluster assembly ATPase SufC [Longimicrobiales bacterium]
MNEPLLRIEDLRAMIGETGAEILKGLSLELPEREIHAIMGPNGSGKSTLAKVLSGHPAYEVTSGSVTYRGRDLLAMEVDERAKAGVFLAFQYPMEIPGVSIANFMRTAVQAGMGDEELDIFEFQEQLVEAMELLDMDRSFATRGVNEGFSGGEKKRNEILQMAMLKPTLAIMDETDSGLDIDALKVVAQGVTRLNEQNGMGVLLITHYQRMLNYVKPDRVHVMVQGRIVESGGPELAEKLDASGYEAWRIEEEVTAAGAAGA